MTLTYRGQKYDQQKVAGGSDKPALTYRGVPTPSDQVLIRRSQAPAFGGGSFCLLISADVAEGDGLGTQSWLKQSYRELEPLKP